ncbi:MAG TPA: hypothetical protein VIX19_12905 [Terriglobales bacterium]
MRVFPLTLLLIFLALTGCGTPGAPQAPSLGIPKPVGDLQAVRKGDQVDLAWSRPTETTDNALVRALGKMLLSRRLVGASAPLQGPQVVAVLALEPALKMPEPPSPTSTDSLSGIPAGGDFVVYTVVSESSLGKTAGPSNQASVPLVPTLPAPGHVSAVAVPLGVSISWDQTWPPENLTHLAAQYAYRVNRREQGATAPPTMIKQVGAGNEALALVDTSIEWQKHYEYWITPVTIWQGAGKKGAVEGADSPVISVFADDKFPPATPEGLEAIYSGLAEQPFIDLSWTPNTEPDLAGYNVYRHAENEPPTKLNSELIKVPSFRDTKVRPGMKYFYSVSAVDLRANESGKSAEASETVP